MSGRARTRARGRTRGQTPSQPVPPEATVPPGATAPPVSSALFSLLYAKDALIPLLLPSHVFSHMHMDFHPT